MTSLNEFLLMLFISSALIIYFFLPQLIPFNWTASGAVISMGPKELALLIPLFTICFYFMWELIPGIAVYHKNLKRFRIKYEHLLTGILLLIMTSYALFIINAFGFTINFLGFIIPLTSVLIFYFATLIRHVKRNYFIGILTPWALSSDKAWYETQKRGGRLLQVYAVILLSLLLLPGEYFIWVIISPLIVILTYSYCHSYEVWKKDSHAQKRRK